MMIVDVHAHLDFENYKDDLDEVLKRAKQANVTAIICNGINKETNRKVLELSKKHDLIKAALGFYPCECDKISEKKFDEEIEFIRKNKRNIVAIGEVGLDKKHDNDFEKQKKCFSKAIDLAKELDIPIIVHSRRAEAKTIELLEQKKARKVVMHCFSGNKQLVERIIKNKWYLSIPTNVVRSQQFQEMTNICPLNQLLTETDSPFLTHDEKIKRNEPAHIKESLKKIAEIKKLDAEELSKIIYANYQRLFL
ncbi:MAG: TatD family hydrolase [Nanoarchaeota archaeon]|nr:TatD family hydrolase [Nanoarchaeota archaeon]MBU1269096.1 TatD family hydrolase [Nanoarchaeota archaeon]MBU1604500.1 TatD family hydrolase [Nanoarchaeota archaeon]MBU2442992.1 TatD family hydrolase [Nanoarchaeota archaeon]